MLLFGREIQLNGSHMREAIAHATHMAEYVTQTNGVPVSLWTTVYSPNAGTLVFTASVPDMTALEAAMDKLMVDDGYHNLVEEGMPYFIPGTLQDRLVTIVHPIEISPERQRAVNYLRTIRSNAVVSRIADAVEVGVQIATRAEELTGSPALFGVEETGPFVGVLWAYGYADAAEADRFNAQVATDPGLGELLGRTKDLFIAGASARTLYRRLL